MKPRLFVVVALLVVLPSISLVAHGSQFTDPSLSAPAIALGQPGLSFRYVRTFGVTEQPYIADVIHLNRPNGLFIDGSNNVYVTEDAGDRVLKYSSAGNNVLALGRAGFCLTGTYEFCTPQDAVLDGSGNIWIADGNRVVEYNSTGVFLQQFPDTEPWVSGNDNTRFDQVHGIAFDSTGRMYVSDTNNHRVQVFDMSGGSPVYSTTIGLAGVPGSGTNQFDLPLRLTIDSSNRLYVVDNGNNRIQRCTYSGSWSCTTFDTGLNNPQGITTDTTSNVYIADTYNGRVRKCTSAGTCGDLIIGTYGLFDVAVDSSGNIYGAAIYEGIVAKYNSSGGLIGAFVGVELVPYLTDGYHYNHPRVAIDSSNNIIVIEENGQRLLKLDPNGTPLWSVGVPGVDAGDNAHFNWPHGVAVGQDGRIYVADGCRVQIFSGSGSYMATLGTGCGTGDYQFNWAAGIAVDNNNYIYVSDASNHRVQIYNNNRVFVGRIGATGQCGSANDRLCWPIGIEVDSIGNIYVADIANCRVQKFNSSRVYQMTFGTTGSCTNGFSAVSAEDVTVDAQGRVYVSGWDERVQFFDSSGAYLTTIGGSGGSNSSQFYGASGVDVDTVGNVYVSDFGNGRIQKFAPGVPGWRQKNLNGFGERWNTAVLALTEFNGQLYSGVGNWTDGASVWRTADGSNWSAVSEYGFGAAYTTTNRAVIGMAVFNNQLYAGTGWGGAPGQIWRSSNGTTWNQITGNGLGESSGAFGTFVVYSNTFYAGTCGDSGTGGTSGAQIWRSTTGSSLSWTNVVTAGNTSIHNNCVTGFTEFNNALYAAVDTDGNADGAQIWRTTTGNNGSWTQVNSSGFGSVYNIQTGGFAIFKGSLYVGTRNDATGAQIWRSSNGTTWTPVMNDGFGDVNNSKVESLHVFEDALYAGTDNLVTGAEVWRTTDGMNWAQINPDGFGDSNNDSTLWSNATATFKNGLYIGTTNGGNGGEVWQLLKQVYLPLILRN